MQSENRSKNRRRLFRFFINFWTILGPQMAPKIIKKIEKTDFRSHLPRFFEDFGARRDPGLDFERFVDILGPFLDDFWLIFGRCFIDFFCLFPQIPE